jgi:hypothetical protein
LRRYVAEFELREGSRTVRRTLEATGIASGDNVEVIYIYRNGKTLINDLMHERLEGCDLLSFSADVNAKVELSRTNALVPHLTLNPMETERHTHHLVKAVVSRQSVAVGNKIPDQPRDVNSCQ